MARTSRGDKAQKTGKGKGLFDDLSIAQVAAGALAAVTSMLLASQIGIYGSVIGVGVGSVVSAVASQLYKKFLQASAEKIQELKPGESGLLGGARAGGPPSSGSSQDAADKGGTPVAGDGPAHAAKEGATVPLARSEARRGAADGLDGDTEVRRARARRAHKKKVQRGVVIVAVVSALLAVGASALIVDFATTGEGVGAKPAPLVGAQSEDRKPSSDEAPKDGSAAEQGSSDGSKQDGSAADGSGSGGSSSGASDGSQDSGGSQDQGSSGTDGGSQGGGSGSGDQPNGGSSGSDEGSKPDSGSDSGTGSGSDSTSGGSSGSGAKQDPQSAVGAGIGDGVRS